MHLQAQRGQHLWPPGGDDPTSPGPSGSTASDLIASGLIASAVIDRWPAKRGRNPLVMAITAHLIPIIKVEGRI